MQITLAILLYLQSICPCTYTSNDINAIIDENKPRIEAVEKDESLTQQIEIDYSAQVDNIVIIDPDIQ